MEILKYGDPKLQQVCSSVEKITEELIDSIQVMFRLMYAADGVGLAAPQVGITQRFFIADIGDGQRYTFINPKITNETDLIRCSEGCLSFPGVFVDVIRYKKLFVKATNLEGKIFKIKASGLLAQVIQHEIEHLDGVLLTNKAVDEAELHLKMQEASLI